MLIKSMKMGNPLRVPFETINTEFTEAGKCLWANFVVFTNFPLFLITLNILLSNCWLQDNLRFAKLLTHYDTFFLRHKTWQRL